MEDSHNALIPCRLVEQGVNIPRVMAINTVKSPVKLKYVTYVVSYVCHSFNFSVSTIMHCSVDHVVIALYHVYKKLCVHYIEFSLNLQYNIIIYNVNHHCYCGQYKYGTFLSLAEPHWQASLAGGASQ